ncbi:MAG: hypothetical protein ACI4TJ_00700 [Candidatus Cryptobacteroides sp.]
MNNTFNFGRFSRIFVHDLQKSVQNYGITFLVLALLPILAPLCYGVLSLCIDLEWSVPGLLTRALLFFLAGTVMILSFAPSVFGKLTDKRHGTEFLMIPASSFEKFLSMTIITSCIAPLLLILAYGLADWLAIGIRLSEGEPLFKFLVRNWVIGEDTVVVHIGSIAALSTGLTSLVILLGSIYFKKFKVGKTLLVMFVLSILLSLLSAPLINLIAGNAEVIERFANEIGDWIIANTGKFNIYLNIFVDAVYVIEYAVVLTLIFLRIKTMKH